MQVSFEVLLHLNNIELVHSFTSFMPSKLPVSVLVPYLDSASTDSESTVNKLLLVHNNGRCQSVQNQHVLYMTLH